MRRASIGLRMLGLATLALPAVGFSDHSTNLLPEDAEIRLALESGPAHLRADATVYVFGESGYRKARSGENGFTCLVNRDGLQNGDDALRPTCWDPEGSRTIVPVMLRVGELIARSASANEIERDISAGFDSGRFSSPQKTGIAYMLLGDIKVDPNTGQVESTAFPPHYMIYAPGVSNADIGMDVESATSAYALPRIYAGYSGGTRTAYVIVLAARSDER